MIEGPSGPVARRRRAASGRCGCRRAGGWNGRTARWRSRFRRKIPSSCAGRNSTPPGATNSPSGATPDATFDMLQFGLRLGARPRQLITTTPRPIPLIKRLVADPRTAVTRAATQANAAHLSPAFLERCWPLCRHAARAAGNRRRDHRGPRRRAVDARDDRGRARSRCAAACGASSSASIRRLPRARAPTPAASSRPGMAEDGCVYVLEDASVQGLAPAGWADEGGGALPPAQGRRDRRRGQPGRRHGARGAGAGGAAVPLRTVHATRGKWLRAEPVAVMYAQGKVKHVDPPLPALEDEMCDFGLGGLSSGALARPARRAGLGGDRADALGTGAGPRARGSRFGPRCLRGRGLNKRRRPNGRRRHALAPNVRYWGQQRTSVETERGTPWSRMTRFGHRPAFHVAVAKPVSAPIKVLV